MLLPLLFSLFLLSSMSMLLVGDSVDMFVDLVIAGVVTLGPRSFLWRCCGSSIGHLC